MPSRRRLVGLAFALLGCGPELPHGDRAEVAAEPIALDRKPPANEPGVERIASGARWIAVVLPEASVDVAPRTEGELVSVRVQTGDPVAEGEVIATLDAGEAREALEMAKAKLDALESACATADLDLMQAKRRLETERALAASGASSVGAVDDAEFAVKRAAAERGRSRASRAEQRALLEHHRRRLDETSIVAPFAGSVVHLYRDVGAIVGPTMPVGRLIGSGPPRIRFAVPPEDASRLAPGDALVVEVDTIDEPMKCTVRQVAAQVDRASHLTFVEADLAGVEAYRRSLRPGLAARVSRPAATGD